MKMFIVCLATLVGLSSCFAERNLQGQIIDAELIRIDTIYRYPDNQQKLTWKCPYNNVEYVTYTNLKLQYNLGSKMPIIVSR